MKIRSVTAFVEVVYPLESEVIATAGEALRAVRQALVETGLEVQTIRLATQPFPLALAEAGPARVADLAQDLEALGFVHEIDYISLGPVQLGDPVAFVESLPDALRSTESVFAGVEIANSGQGIGLPRVRRVAELIRRVATLTEDGFTNLRLTALSNVPAWAPFFPAAYHGGGKSRIAIATQSADLALAAISSANTLDTARSGLIRAIEMEAERVEKAVKSALEPFDIGYEGLDFSLAPYPDEDTSIGGALENLGLPVIGGPGTLMAAAFLTDALNRAQFKQTGFNGLMLPVLEDSVLARRAAEGYLTITDLLTFSAVCGTGLDTIPLPGDVSTDSLSAILVDVAALALRLDKPLTARLMPIPGKTAGDAITFDFEYFAESAVMSPEVLSTESDALTGLLAGDEDIDVQPRMPH
jgi:uncharacterized protein (UPF0210 family)